MEATKWTILNKYPFTLLPGEPKVMPDGDLSYYAYLNMRWAETGKNVLAVQWLLRNFPQGLSIVEPFGGCGVFSVALQETMKPSYHRISELDADCYAQLTSAMSKYQSASVFNEDAHQTLGTVPADIFVCDFPYFTLTRHSNGYWATELERVVSLKPKAIIITDGTACRFHLVAKYLQKRGHDVTADRESYAYAFDKVMSEKYGYHVTGLAYHSNCFYIRLEPEPREIEFFRIPNRSGADGLRPVEA